VPVVVWRFAGPWGLCVARWPPMCGGGGSALVAPGFWPAPGLLCLGVLGWWVCTRRGSVVWAGLGCMLGGRGVGHGLCVWAVAWCCLRLPGAGV